MTHKNFSYYIEHFIYYVLIYFILQQWLNPISELADISKVEYISVFIIGCLVLALVGVPFYISWVLKGLYILWFITITYSPYTLFSSDGIRFLREEMSYNLAVLLKAQWGLVTDPFNTLLFLLLVWMVVYLIQYWITVRMSIFFLFIGTVIFIGVMDTFTDYDGTLEIIKVVVIGLLMTGLLAIKRLLYQAEYMIDWHKAFRFALPLIGSVLLCSAVALALPKASPQWPDPVPFFKGATGSGEGGGGTGNTVGYSADDSELGGPFRPNSEHVFTVQSKTKQYWRVETKNLYTSKGWESRSLGEIETNWGNYIDQTVNIGTEETQEATVTPQSDYDFLIYPYGSKIFYQTSESATYLRVDEATEKIIILASTEPVEYVVEFSEPTYSYTALKESRIEEKMSEYLQLPSNLPLRIGELAKELTAAYESPYDKARMIQTYFQRNGFRYETRDVAVPGEDQDYVDQFLFETKKGYCDNFSTAMVVMLRTIGIEARWVKGFTSGTEVPSSNSEYRTYEITNDNAHSWVEAYIPGVGWMPFEPTIGYTNPADIDYDLTSDATSDEALLREQEEQKQEQLKQEKEEPKEKEAKEKAQNSKLLQINWGKLIFIFAAILLVLIMALFLFRRKWLPKYYIRQQRKNGIDAQNIEKAYLRLVKHLTSRGIRKEPHQTLAEYAQKVDEMLGNSHMTRFTAVYERVIYGGNTENISSLEMLESWEYLINGTTG